MKKFKTIDLYISYTLMGSLTLLALIDSSKIFWPYFGVGGWHVASMLTHWIKGWFMTKDSYRRWFHRRVIWLALVVALSAIVPEFLMLMLFLLLFVTPFMAILYVKISYNEVAWLKKNAALSLR